MIQLGLMYQVGIQDFNLNLFQCRSYLTLRSFLFRETNILVLAHKVSTMYQTFSSKTLSLYANHQLQFKQKFGPINNVLHHKDVSSLGLFVVLRQKHFLLTRHN